MVEPRVILRALCPTEPGELAVLGEDAPFWDELGALLAAPAGAPVGDRAASAGIVEDRRGEGFAGVAGDLFSSGETVLVAVADVPRRRAGLEAVVAGLSDGRCRSPPGARWPRTASWRRASTTSSRSTRRPAGSAIRSCASPLAPISPGARPRPSSRSRPGAPSSTCALSWRRSTAPCASCRPTPPEPTSKPPCAAAGRYPRSARACARLARVLDELSLIELDPGARTCRVLDASRSDLERSPTYRASRDELAAIERALGVRAG